MFVSSSVLSSLAISLSECLISDIDVQMDDNNFINNLRGTAQGLQEDPAQEP